MNCVNKGLYSSIQSNYTDKSMVLPKVKLWYDKLLSNCIVLTLLKQDTNKCIFIKNYAYCLMEGMRRNLWMKICFSETRKHGRCDI